VTCVVAQTVSPDGLAEADCRVGKDNIGRVMVETGLAQSGFLYTRDVSDIARADKRGLWNDGSR